MNDSSLAFAHQLRHVRCETHGMLMRAPSDKTPELPPRGGRDTDGWLAVVAFVVFVVAVVFAVYAVFTR